MASVKIPTKQVRPLLSLDAAEARRRALGLYRALYRLIPYIVQKYDIPKSEQQCRTKLRELFYKNAKVTDTRVIDMLVIKGYMEMKEISEIWMQKGRLMNYWKPTLEPKPTSFIDKFIDGHD